MAQASAPRDRSNEFRSANLRFIHSEDHYIELLCRRLPEARFAVWVATANLKELRIEAPIGTRARARGRYVSVLETLEQLAQRGVDIRILHSRPPSGPFQRELGRRRGLQRKLLLELCPRVHMKLLIIDGRWLYLGSANFTGAGLGARQAQSRNFELGILTDDEYLLDASQATFERIWSGAECGSCRLRAKCPNPLDAKPSRRPGRK